MDRSDVIVVGAGHNGLVAAGYLARAGLAVTVLERRNVVGGVCVTEELLPGARFSTGAILVSSLRRQVIEDLELERFGLELYATDVLNIALDQSGAHVFLWPELDRTMRELARLSPHDAASVGHLSRRFQRFAAIMEPYLLREPPALSEVIARFEAEGAIDLWHEFVTISIGDLVDHYFEHELVKGLFMFPALVSVYAGPYAPGTAYEFSHHSWGEYKGDFGRFGLARGGMGAITQALAASARHHGAEIYTGVSVERILVERGAVTGVQVSDCSVLRAPVVISNADPQRTYLHLIEPDHLPPEAHALVHRIDMRGSMGRVHLLVDELPHYVGLPAEEGPQHRGFMLLGVTPTAFQRGWEAQVRGDLMEEYPLEVIIPSVTDQSLAPAGLHTITTGTQQLPFELAQGTWDSRKDEYTAHVLRSLFRYAPNLQGAIRGQVTLTPLDWEREYGLSGGNIFHGAMFTNQLFASRPVAGMGGYRTPVRGLYLCGAGTHPGGAVMGACGHNAAHAVLADLQATPARMTHT